MVAVDGAADEGQPGGGPVEFDRLTGGRGVVRAAGGRVRPGEGETGRRAPPAGGQTGRGEGLAGVAPAAAVVVGLVVVAPVGRDAGVVVGGRQGARGGHRQGDGLFVGGVAGDHRDPDVVEALSGVLGRGQGDLLGAVGDRALGGRGRDGGRGPDPEAHLGSGAAAQGRRADAGPRAAAGCDRGGGGADADLVRLLAPPEGGRRRGRAPGAVRGGGQGVVQPAAVTDEGGGQPGTVAAAAVDLCSPGSTQACRTAPLRPGRRCRRSWRRSADRRTGSDRRRAPGPPRSPRERGTGVPRLRPDRAWGHRRPRAPLPAAGTWDVNA